jgi:hypothetical protein
VNSIPCRHILLVLDVCFSGTFDSKVASRGQDPYEDLAPSTMLLQKMPLRTRRYLTSGGKVYVSDGRPGYHSPFARRFLEALRTYGGNDGVLTFSGILPFVEKVDPAPYWGEFGDNQPGSEFFLLTKSTAETLRGKQQ